MSAVRMREVRSSLVLRGLPGLGPVRFKEIIEAFGTARGALAGPERGLERWVGSPGLAALRAGTSLRQAHAVMERCRRGGIGITALGLSDYPAHLRDLADPPPVLYWKGSLTLLRSSCVAVVGSRRATGYGRRVARKLGRFLAESGRPVLSGMALGVDAEAHWGALPGPTAAVLGSGVDVPAPVRNRALYDAILEQGLVLSTFDPGTPPAPQHFPARNRVIAALADEIVVVEAGVQSGALITAGIGLDLGREVHAVPGPIDRPTSAGTNRLIADGAVPLLRIEDRHSSLGRGDRTGPQDDTLREIWIQVPAHPVSFDELVEACGSPPQRLSAGLTRLELLGYISVTADGRFLRVGSGS